MNFFHLNILLTQSFINPLQKELIRSLKDVLRDQPIKRKRFVQLGQENGSHIMESPDFNVLLPKVGLPPDKYENLYLLNLSLIIHFLVLVILCSILFVMFGMKKTEGFIYNRYAYRPGKKVLKALPKM